MSKIGITGGNYGRIFYEVENWGHGWKIIEIRCKSDEAKWKVLEGRWKQMVNSRNKINSKKKLVKTVRNTWKTDGNKL